MPLAGEWNAGRQVMYGPDELLWLVLSIEV